MAGFEQNKGVNIRFSHQDPQKAHPSPKRRLMTYFVKICSGVWAVATCKNPKNKRKNYSHPRRTSKSRIRGAETPEPIARPTEFCIPGAVHDVIMHANFSEDRLKGFGVAMGQILAFSTDLLCRLYNTLALPYECVMVILTVS